MKNKILLVVFLLGGFVFQKAAAQIRVGVKINIGTQPAWGPVGYDHVDYYYMPDIDAYYYVPNRQYIYQERGRWRFTTSLPSRFHYDVNTGYKVVVNEPRPYLQGDVYRTKYTGFKGRHDQEIIRNSQDSKYFENKGHPQHNKWVNDHNRRNNPDRHH
jgi:hypothetical protein